MTQVEKGTCIFTCRKELAVLELSDAPQLQYKSYVFLYECFGKICYLLFQGKIISVTLYSIHIANEISSENRYLL
jgi:hypothetical protein